VLLVPGPLQLTMFFLNQESLGLNPLRKRNGN